jgi:hypothetical protein
MHREKTTKVILSDQQGAKNPSFTAFDVASRADRKNPKPKKRDSSAAAAASE